jgi:putative hydrolase of the HAD superfamily
MIQAIVYDAVGTLIHVKPSVAGIYAEFGRRFGSRLDDAELRRRFQTAFARQDRLDEDAGWRTSEIRERTRWRDIVTDVLNAVADPDGCFESLYAEFSKPEVWSYDPEALEVLAAMEGRGYRQAMASNFDRRLHGVIAAMPPTLYLERVVVSSEVGWRKPAPEFFTALAAALRLSPDAILFVGDDRGNDYDAARRAGMRGLLLDPQQRHPDAGSDRLDRLSALIAAI